MQKEEIKKIILDYLIEEFGDNSEVRRKHYSYCLFPAEECTCRFIEEINYDTKLIEGGYITSFSVLSVIVFLENKFKIKISEKDLFIMNFNTVDNMTNLITKYL
jgi:acyl carrier protein